MIKQLEKLKQLIKTSKKIALLSHIRMDPDTFWSATALYYVLQKIWKNVVLLNDEKAPKEFEFLAANEIVKTNYCLKNFNPDLIISLDAADTKQLWESYSKNKETIKNKTLVVIDHHITNPWFWDINLISTSSSSTCEFLYEIMLEIDLIKYVNKGISTLLMAWILTDTNIFYNTNVTSKTHKIAWKLIELWADSRTSIFEFFKKKSFKKTMLISKVLSNTKLIKWKLKNWKNIVYSIIKQTDFKQTKTNDNDTDWMVEDLINIENSEIAFIVYPVKDRNKISIRSREYDISKIAQKMWWWGHKNAAWFYSDKKVEQIIEELVEKIKKL